MGMNRRASVVALVSGGLDSLCLVQALRRMRRVVYPVYVRCGLVWEAVELFWLREWLAKMSVSHVRTLKVLQMPLHTVYERHWSLTGRGIPAHTSRDAAVYLPGRNVLLIGHVAVYAAQQGLSTLAIGTLAGNPFGDATPDFFRRFAACLSQALEQSMQLITPLRRWTKAQLIQSNPRQPFHLTFSCLHPRGRRHCGRCKKCAERQRAFRQARVPDPTHYAR